MGRNPIGRIMPDIAKKLNWIGRITNHSVRKTSCDKLFNRDLNPNLIIQVSGHKTLQSINNYAKANFRTQKNLYYIIVANENAGSIRVPAQKSPKLRENKLSLKRKAPTSKENVPAMSSSESMNTMNLNSHNSDPRFSYRSHLPWSSHIYHSEHRPRSPQIKVEKTPLKRSDISKLE